MRNVEFDIEEGALIASLSGEIDHYAAADMRREIDSAMERSRLKDLVLDYSGVSFMDSSGIGVIMGRYKTVKTLGGKVVIFGVNKQIERIVAMSGIDRIVETAKNLSDALNLI